LYFPYHFTIQLTFLSHFPHLFTFQLTFPPFVHINSHCKLKCEMIWKIWKKSKLNSEKIWKIQKKGKLNSEKIWKIQKKIVKWYEKYGFPWLFRWLIYLFSI
jgi:hypothetical protein